MTNEHGMREEKARDSTAKDRRRLRRPTCLRIARRSATARADGCKNWLLASCSGGLSLAVPGVDAPSSDVHAISTRCCDGWMWERTSEKRDKEGRERKKERWKMKGVSGSRVAGNGGQKYARPAVSRDSCARRWGR